jgi:hypothetical protein
MYQLVNKRPTVISLREEDIAMPRSPRSHPRQFISIQTIAGVVAQRRRSRPRPAFRRELNDTARMIAHRLTRGPHKNTMAEAVARRLRRRRQNPIDAIATQVTRRLQRSSAESEVTAETIVNAGASEQIP